ncbi:hypothetical protein BGZ83_003693 [Gryganskiella cystojenkinii]|nr:hypothetical protein BGZ83_003693 [Gryganskiella cystojenkinii]
MTHHNLAPSDDDSLRHSPPQTSSSSSSLSNHHLQGLSALPQHQRVKTSGHHRTEDDSNSIRSNNSHHRRQHHQRSVNDNYFEDDQEAVEYDPYAFDDYEERIIGLEDTEWDEEEDGDELDSSHGGGTEDGGGTWLDFLNGLDSKREEGDADKTRKGHHVIISGAGLGGLMLANLLEKAEISYQILERAPEPQVTGAVMSLSGNILPVFEQLGMYEELRNELYNILISKIPSHKIHFSKRVAQISQDENGVTVKCTDKSITKGDILVGAVVTNPSCYAAVMISDKEPFTWATFTVPSQKVCWNIVIQLTEKESEEEQFRNSQWSPEVGEKLKAKVYHYKTPFGELGALIDATPADRISRVFLEDKLYETWNHERVVLLGDAAHKILPSTGQGAVAALLDAVVLANQLYEIDGEPHEAIVEALQEYRRQRFKHVKKQHESGQLNAKIQFGHTFFERVLRHSVLTYLPKSLQKKQFVKDNAYRPEAMFLPPAPKRGTGPVLPQKRSKRYAREQAEALLSKTISLETTPPPLPPSQQQHEIQHQPPRQNDSAAAAEAD